MTYRTGNHWGVTIVREGERTPEGHITGADQLVAVVVNGDQALAERICALLNADEQAASHADDCNCGESYTDPWCAPRQPSTPEPVPSAQAIADVLAVVDAPYRPDGLVATFEEDA